VKCTTKEVMERLDNRARQEKSRRIHHVPCTATEIPFMYSFLRIAWPQSQFLHSCVCERFISSQDRSTYFLQQNRQTDLGNVKIAHKHMNVVIGTVGGRAIPFLGIYGSLQCFLKHSCQN
jgi:hypothetical protein